MTEGGTKAELLRQILYLSNVSSEAKLLFLLAAVCVTEINIHRPCKNVNFSI